MLKTFHPKCSSALFVSNKLCRKPSCLLFIQRNKSTYLDMNSSQQYTKLPCDFKHLQDKQQQNIISSLMFLLYPSALQDTLKSFAQTINFQFVGQDRNKLNSNLFPNYHILIILVTLWYFHRIQDYGILSKKYIYNTYIIRIKMVFFRVVFSYIHFSAKQLNFTFFMEQLLLSRTNIFNNTMVLPKGRRAIKSP